MTFWNIWIFISFFLITASNDECSYDVHKFKYSSQKKILISKQNNNKARGNEKLFLATVIEFVYVITALVFRKSWALDESVLKLTKCKLFAYNSACDVYKTKKINSPKIHYGLLIVFLHRFFAITWWFALEVDGIPFSTTSTNMTLVGVKPVSG